MSDTSDNTGDSPAELEAALRETPRGAFALAALMVAALLIGWFGLYFLVFLPRGVVG